MNENSKRNARQRIRQLMGDLRRKLPLPRLWHLSLDLRSIDSIFKPLIAAASGKEKAELDAEWFFEIQMIEEERKDILTRRLTRKARRLYVSVPSIQRRDNDENWEQGHATGLFYLKPEGTEKVREAIHRERKRRQEVLLPWVAPLIGLIGALIGLVSALKF